MRFRRPTRAERQKEKALKIKNWHKKFVWLPVRLESDDNEIRWLEFVFRRGRADTRPHWLWKTYYVYGYDWKYADSSLDVLRLDNKE